MQGMMRVQEWIHRMELGAGAKYVRWFAAVIGFAMLAVIYDSLCFRNFTNAEAMDAAQLGRNISQGRGYTTYFVRPLSIELTRKARPDKSPLLKEGHRDISNPPVYPLVLAGVLRVTPDPTDLLAVKNFSIYAPNMYIAVFNQMLFGLGALLVFRLALRWFNLHVAWMSAVLFLLTELYWRFTVSGLSTMLVIDLVLLLVLLLSIFERRARENGTPAKLLLNALMIGITAGFVMLTRYSLGLLILPTLIFIAACGARRRWVWTGAALVAFAIIVTPWLIRNVIASGLPFGTATYAVVDGTPAFPGDTLERSLNPSFRGMPGQEWQMFVMVMHKGINGVKESVSSELPRLGGNWLWSFFLAGLLVRFQSVNLSRLRWFVVGSLALLIPVQAFARTHLSADSPEINSENLLVVFSPLVLIFAVGLFFILFESLPLPSAPVRYISLAGFAAVISLPLMLALLPPRPARFSPPYYAPRLQQIARYMDRREMWMSDIPWAIAWYGERPCVGLTLDWGPDFFAINDFHKTVNGLYISTRTTDARFISNWFGGENRGWGKFLLQSFVAMEVPKGFPLKHSPEKLFSAGNGELLLTDRDRWSTAGVQQNN
jgi:hypothetical protein